MRIAQLLSKTVSTTLTIDGDTINYAFKPGGITPRVIADIDGIKTATEIMAISQHVVDIIAEWDLQQDDGTPFPLEVERIQNEIPLPFQIDVIQDAVSKMRGNAAAAQTKN